MIMITNVAMAIINCRSSAELGKTAITTVVNIFCFAAQEPTHKDARMDYVLEDMQVMSDFELHKLCLKYEVCF